MHRIRNITLSKYEWVEFEFSTLSQCGVQKFLIKHR